MLADNTESTQQAEQKRQNLRLWVGASLGVSSPVLFVFIGVFLVQGIHDVDLIWAFRSLVIAFLLLILALGWKEIDIFALKVPLGLLASGVVFAYIRLTLTILHIDKVVGILVAVITIVAVIAGFLKLPKASSRHTHVRTTHMQ